VGNREDLLAGAKRCLFDKGFARTTARDIAAASGVSLAAIGYHFGTKEALLNAALQEALKEWGDDLEAMLADGTDFVSTWNKVRASFEQSRALWAIQFELIAQAGRDPALRAPMAEANRLARAGLEDLLRSPGAGAFYQVLLAGLAAVWLVDPQGAPTGAELLAAMRQLTSTA
jgi:AcrR family transcriptional regulator